MLQRKNLGNLGIVRFTSVMSMKRSSHGRGAWTCQYFDYDANFPYVTVREAAETLSVSEATVRRWVKLGKLNGWLFVKGRNDLNVPKKKYFIEASSVEKLRKVEKEGLKGGSIN